MTNRTLSGRLAQLERAEPAAAWRPYVGRPLREWPGDAFLACFAAGERFDREALDALATFSDADLLDIIGREGSEP